MTPLLADAIAAPENIEAHVVYVGKWLLVALAFAAIVLIILWVLYRRWLWKNIFMITLIGTLAPNHSAFVLRIWEIGDLAIVPPETHWTVQVTLAILHFLTLLSSRNKNGGNNGGQRGGGMRLIVARIKVRSGETGINIAALGCVVIVFNLVCHLSFITGFLPWVGNLIYSDSLAAFVVVAVQTCYAGFLAAFVSLAHLHRDAVLPEEEVAPVRSDDEDQTGIGARAT